MVSSVHGPPAGHLHSFYETPPIVTVVRTCRNDAQEAAKLTMRRSIFNRMIGRDDLDRDTTFTDSIIGSPTVHAQLPVCSSNWNHPARPKPCQVF